MLEPHMCRAWKLARLPRFLHAWRQTSRQYITMCAHIKHTLAIRFSVFIVPPGDALQILISRNPFALSNDFSCLSSFFQDFNAKLNFVLVRECRTSIAAWAGDSSRECLINFTSLTVNVCSAHEHVSKQTWAGRNRLGNERKIWLISSAMWTGETRKLKICWGEKWSRFTDVDGLFWYLIYFLRYRLKFRRNRWSPASNLEHCWDWLTTISEIQRRIGAQTRRYQLWSQNHRKSLWQLPPRKLESHSGKRL